MTDGTEPMLIAEPTQNAEAKEPTEPRDRIEPAEPIDKMDPLDPMLRIEPEEPIESSEPSSPLLRMRALSQHGRRPGPAGRVAASGGSGGCSRPVRLAGLP